MASNQASAAEQVSTTHGSGGGQANDKVALDRELYCPRLELLLCASAQAHGLRGTLASVTATLERGGAGGSGDPEAMMALRLDGAPLGQYRELGWRWQKLEPEHQAILMARYLLTSRAHESVRARFGQLAGVVLYRWLRRAAADRAREVKPRLAKIQEKLDPLRAAIAPLERELYDLLAYPAGRPHDAELAARRPTKPPAPEPTGDEKADKEALRAWRAAWREAIRPWHAEDDATREAWRAERAIIDQRITQTRAALWPLQAEAAKLVSNQATLTAAAAGDVERDTRELLDVCKKGERTDLLNAATTATKTSHRAWYGTAKKASKVWAEGDIA